MHYAFLDLRAGVRRDLRADRRTRRGALGRPDGFPPRRDQPQRRWPRRVLPRTRRSLPRGHHAPLRKRELARTLTTLSVAPGIPEARVPTARPRTCHTVTTSGAELRQGLSQESAERPPELAIEVAVAVTQLVDRPAGRRERGGAAAAPRAGSGRRQRRASSRPAGSQHRRPASTHRAGTGTATPMLGRSHNVATSSAGSVARESTTDDRDVVFDVRPGRDWRAAARCPAATRPSGRWPCERGTRGDRRSCGSAPSPRPPTTSRPTRLPAVGGRCPGLPCVRGAGR